MSFVLRRKLREYSDGSFLCNHILTGQEIWLEQEHIDSKFKLLEYDSFEDAEAMMVSYVIKNNNQKFSEQDSDSIEIEVVEFTEKLNKASNFNRCRFKWFKDNGSTTEMGYICRCQEHPRRNESDKHYPSPDITPEECKECPLFRTRYIEYPIEVTEIIDDYSKVMNNKWKTKNMGQLVKVRYCKDDKTYLGIHLGDGMTGNHISHDSNTNILTVYPDTNPAIFVPSLKKIIYGYESWWGIIKSEEDLKEISDEDLNNVWYVKLLKDMNK